MSLLFNFLQKTQQQILEEKSKYTTEEISVAKEIAEAIKTKKTEYILKQLEKSGELIHLVDFYERKKNETPSQLIEFLRSGAEGRRTYEVIVSVHLLEVLRGRESVTWPRKVSLKKKSIQQEI